MYKLIIKYIIRGMGWGCFLLVLNTVIYDLTAPDALQVIFNHFTAHAIAFLVLGMAVGGGSILYEIERFHFGIKMILHITVVTLTLLVIGFIASPTPLENPTVLIATILVNALLLCIIWGGVYLHGRYEVREMNKRLKDII